MKEPDTKQEMLELISKEWDALYSVIQDVDPKKMDEPSVVGNWSVKDIQAHITTWERLMTQWLDESLRGETPNRPGPGSTWDDLDEFNELLYQENTTKSLDQVQQEFDGIHQQAVNTIESMEENDLFDPDRFAWREGDPIWHMVAGNTWWHYKEHRQSITEWVEASS